MARGTIRLVLGSLALGMAAGGAGAQIQREISPIDIRVPKAPTPVLAHDSLVYIYELRITNLMPRNIAVAGIEIRDAGDSTRMLGIWSGDALKNAMVSVPKVPSEDARLLPSGRQRVFFAYVTVGATKPPRALVHTLYLTGADSLTATPTDTVRRFSVVALTHPPPVLAPPMREGFWLAANGPSNTSDHRRTIIPIDGLARIAQRFATDWVLMDSTGRLFHGDSTKNENWFGYRTPLRAVANATVVVTHDGIPENQAMAPNRAVPITLETVGGNHIILDLGNGQYAFYAHLVPGSLRVKVGERVKAGQVIGLLGNSGNSDAPHLHFHVEDAPSPLGAEGLPFVFASYIDHGRSGGWGASEWKTVPPGSPRVLQTPLENDIVEIRK